MTLSRADTLDMLTGVALHVDSELEEVLREQRLSRASFQVLHALAAAAEGELTQRELAARVRRAAGTLSVRLVRLERAGLVSRDPNPDDRRATHVRITARGRERLERATELYEQQARRLTEALSDEEVSALDGQLRRWLAFFEPSPERAPVLGVAIAPAATANRMRRAVGLPAAPGILVLGVRPDSPAARAGLARGDLITQAGGGAVRTIADLERAVAGAERALALEGLRGAEPLALSVELGEGSPSTSR
jgi:DNA-binding MarR family transcriptional regulator